MLERREVAERYRQRFTKLMQEQDARDDGQDTLLAQILARLALAESALGSGAGAAVLARLAALESIAMPNGGRVRLGYVGNSPVITVAGLLLNLPQDVAVTFPAPFASDAGYTLVPVIYGGTANGAKAVPKSQTKAGGVVTVTAGLLAGSAIMVVLGIAP